jgi:hypothetical protein
MGTRIKDRSDEDRMELPKALKRLKRKYPWAPIAALRKAVSEGRVPAVRSSLGARARYYVRIDDLERVLLSVQVAGE